MAVMTGGAYDVVGDTERWPSTTTDHDNDVPAPGAVVHVICVLGEVTLQLVGTNVSVVEPARAEYDAEIDTVGSFPGPKLRPVSCTRLPPRVSRPLTGWNAVIIGGA